MSTYATKPQSLPKPSKYVWQDYHAPTPVADGKNSSCGVGFRPALP